MKDSELFFSYIQSAYNDAIEKGRDDIASYILSVLSELGIPIEFDGGDGSGNWGHEGRPGEIGGSASGGGVHNRVKTESGSYTSFSKKQKAASKPHAISKAELIEIQKPGTKIIAGGRTIEYNGMHDQFVDTETGEFVVGNDLKGFLTDARVLIPDDQNPNFRLVKEKINASEYDRKFGSAFSASKGEDADGVLRESAGEAWRSFDKETRGDLWDYTDSSYLAINKTLRTGKTGGENTESQIRHITEAISQTKLEQDMILHRGIDRAAFSKMVGIKEEALTPEIADKLVGVTGVDKAFMSTGSYKGGGLHRQVSLEILAPKGTEALYAEPFSAYGFGAGRSWDGVSPQTSFSGECETLLQRGSSFMIVSGRYEEEENAYHFQMVITGQNYENRE